MHWWMKQMLFILSISVLTACSSEKDQQGEDNNVFLNPIEEFMNQLFYLETLESPLIDSLVERIHFAQNEINGFTTKNAVDPGKLLFTAAHDSILTPLVRTLQSRVEYYRNFQTYRIWKSKKLEFSLSPHPTENWVFMVREL